MTKDDALDTERATTEKKPWEGVVSGGGEK